MEAASGSAEPGWTSLELKALVIGALFFGDDWDAVCQLVPGKQARGCPFPAAPADSAAADGARVRLACSRKAERKPPWEVRTPPALLIDPLFAPTTTPLHYRRRLRSRRCAPTR